MKTDSPRQAGLLGHGQSWESTSGLFLRPISSHYWQMYVWGGSAPPTSSYSLGRLLCVGPMLGTLYNKITRDKVHKEHAGAGQAS